MAQGRFNRRDVSIGHANFIRQRPEHGLALLQGGESAGAEAFVLGLKLLEHVEA